MYTNTKFIFWLSKQKRLGNVDKTSNNKSKGQKNNS